jgi:hypothetical protein
MAQQVATSVLGFNARPCVWPSEGPIIFCMGPYLQVHADRTWLITDRAAATGWRRSCVYLRLVERPSTKALARARQKVQAHNAKSLVQVDKSNI